MITTKLKKLSKSTYRYNNLQGDGEPWVPNDARPTSMQLKKAAQLSTMTGLQIKHADCHITYKLYHILSYF